VTADDPRVLFVASWYPSYDLPGRAIFVADQATALLASGLSVEVVSPEEATSFGTYGGGDASASQRAAGAAWCEEIRSRGPGGTPTSWGAPGVPTSRLPVATPRVAGARVDPRAFAASAADVLQAWAGAPSRVSPTIVHAHVGLPDGVAAIALADRLGVPLITTEHDSTAEGRLALPGMREAYLPLLDHGRMLLAVSESLRRRLAGALEVDPGRIGVVPNVVDAGAFALADRITDRHPGELLWVGGLKAGKGIDGLLAAFARLHASRPGLRLRLIGRAPAGAEEQRLQAVAHDLGVLDAVAFEGQVPRVAVAEAMARAAVFVHPSPSETFGVVAAEALAAGLPVAATPSGGVEEIVGRDGRFGEIAADQSPEALAAAIARVLDDPARFDPHLMRASVVGRFSPDAVAGQLRAHYAELLERRAARAVHGRRVATPVRRTGDGRDETAGAAPAPRDRPLHVVVCMRRGLATARLLAMPRDLARGLLVVTVGPGDAGGQPLPDGPRWIELDPDRAYNAARGALGGRKGSRRPWHRIARLLGNPMRPVRLRRLGAERPALRAPSLRADLAALLAGIDMDAGVEVVALSADDVDLVLPLLDHRVRLWPGTLRGLVDRWDAAGRPVVPSVELQGPAGE
jgi:glycosyltransferase involved in cell wall biosynthesis